MLLFGTYKSFGRNLLQSQNFYISACEYKNFTFCAEYL